MAATVQETIGTYFYKLSLGGAESAGFFREVSGLSSETSIVEQTATDKMGKSLVQKFPGQLKWANITLKRGVDKDNALWKWRQLVIDGKINEARKDGTIEVMDFQGSPLITFAFIRAWPCKYSAPGLNAGGNEILVEEVEIVHEGFKRV